MKKLTKLLIIVFTISLFNYSSTHAAGTDSGGNDNANLYKQGKKLVYGVLEGPEHAVYVRGKVDTNCIDLPEEWIGLVDEDSITVQLTPIGKHQNLYVDEINNTKILIKNSNLLTKSINAFYFIQATRKDIQPLQTERDA